MRAGYYYLLALIASFLTATIGGSFTVLDDWYYSLNQPAWKPDDLVFPIVWTTIFFLCAISVGILLNRAANRQKKFRIAYCFILNAFLNIFWSYLYFFIQRPDIALLEVVFLWGSILLLIMISKTVSTIASLMLFPYLVWVSIASILNYQTVILNNFL